MGSKEKADGNGFVVALEEEATAQLSQISAYRTYQGNNPDYKQRAKLAIGVIGAYVRLRATMANERTNDLVEKRLLGDGDRRPLELKAGE